MRHLKFEKLQEIDGWVVFRISEQTHRGDEFTPTGNNFRSLHSIVMPRSACWTCHVRGDSTKHDNKPIVCSKKEYALFAKDKDKYNKKFKGE